MTGRISSSVVRALIRQNTAKGGRATRLPLKRISNPAGGRAMKTANMNHAFAGTKTTSTNFVTSKLAGYIGKNSGNAQTKTDFSAVKFTSTLSPQIPSPPQNPSNFASGAKMPSPPPPPPLPADGNIAAALGSMPSSPPSSQPLSTGNTGVPQGAPQPPPPPPLPADGNIAAALGSMPSPPSSQPLSTGNTGVPQGAPPPPPPPPLPPSGNIGAALGGPPPPPPLPPGGNIAAALGKAPPPPPLPPNGDFAAAIQGAGSKLSPLTDAGKTEGKKFTPPPKTEVQNSFLDALQKSDMFRERAQSLEGETAQRETELQAKLEKLNNDPIFQARQKEKAEKAQREKAEGLKKPKGDNTANTDFMAQLKLAMQKRRVAIAGEGELPETTGTADENPTSTPTTPRPVPKKATPQAPIFAPSKDFLAELQQRLAQRNGEAPSTQNTNAQDGDKTTDNE